MSEQNEYEFQMTPPAEEPSMPPMEQPPAKHHHKKKNTALKLCTLALVFSLLGAAVGAGAAIWYQKDKQPAETEQNVTSVLMGIRENSRIDISSVETGALMTPAEVYAANVNSTVGITTSITTNYWGFQTTSAASGSGFIITQDGYILTNYHVIESASSITVSLYDGIAYEAALIGYDESNDIAVLKVDAEGLSPVILGDSDNLNVGDSVVAIGNPLGELTFSLTAGLVSAKDREVTLSSSVTMDLIQTDCAINSGNSGGALFNLYGEVIGITNAKYSSSSYSEASIDNIGFAIPINSVLDIVESIIEKGYISKPYIGIYMSDVTAQTQLYGIPAGAAIQSVIEDSPAEAAGLQAGDVITHVDGVQISGSSELGNIVGAASVGDQMVMTVYRQGSTIEITVTIGEQIQSALADEEAEQAQTQDYSQYQQGGFPFGGFGSRP